MEYDKINNLLLSEDNENEVLSKFVTREYVRINSLLNTYNENVIYVIILMLIY